MDTPEVNKSTVGGQLTGIRMVQFTNSSDVKQVRLNVDQILEDIVKPCGLWQWFLTLFLLLSSTSIVTFDVFANSASPHRCRMESDIEEQIRASNLTFDEIASIIGPWYTTDQSNSYKAYGCVRYSRNWTVDYFYSTMYSNFTGTFADHEVEPCPYGYLHQNSIYHYPNNLVKEFAIVCEKSWLVPLGTSMFILGMMFGFVSGGFVGDRYGRKKALIVFSFLEVIGATWTSLSNHYITYVLGRFMMAFGNTGKVNVANVLVLELTVARYRSLFGATLASGTHFFYRSLLALWAYCIPNWRWLNVVTMVPNLFALLYFLLIPESPRWLLAQNRPQKALEVLRLGYRFNSFFKNDVGLHKIDQLIKEVAQYGTQDRCETLDKTKAKILLFLFKSFSTYVLAKTTLLCLSLIGGITMCFLGLLYYARVVHNYVYLTAFLNACTAIPSSLIAVLLYRYFRRRRPPLMVLMILAICVLTFSSVFTMVLQPNTDIVLTVCSNIALILINAAMNMCFIYVPELFPSEVRTQGFGMALGLSRLITMACTFINELDKYWLHGSPLLIYAVILLLVLGVFIDLRDTKGENLPDLLTQISDETNKNSKDPLANKNC